MSEILTQEEIDQLLTAINADGTPINPINGFSDIETFEKYLVKREFNPEKPYGIFDKDVSICRYFNPGNNDNLLADILITNIIQYTPLNMIMNFIDGTNVKKGDLLFDEWKKA